MRLPCCRLGALSLWLLGTDGQPSDALLYANQLASIEHLAIDPDLDGRVRQSIDRVMDRQDSNGAFGLWKAGGDDDDLWLDAFVSDFLTRARERSFAVPQLGFNQALDRLRNEVTNAADPGDGAGEPLAYALYVLARNGRPVISDLRYLADTKLASSRRRPAQIAAALAMSATGREPARYLASPW